jgi:hypothetical protein
MRAAAEQRQLQQPKKLRRAKATGKKATVAEPMAAAAAHATMPTDADGAAPSNTGEEVAPMDVDVQPSSSAQDASATSVAAAPVADVAALPAKVKRKKKGATASNPAALAELMKEQALQNPITVSGPYTAAAQPNVSGPLVSVSTATASSAKTSDSSSPVAPSIGARLSESVARLVSAAATSMPRPALPGQDFLRSRHAKEQKAKALIRGKKRPATSTAEGGAPKKPRASRKTKSASSSASKPASTNLYGSLASGASESATITPAVADAVSIDRKAELSSAKPTSAAASLPERPVVAVTPPQAAAPASAASPDVPAPAAAPAPLRRRHVSAPAPVTPVPIRLRSGEVVNSVLLEEAAEAAAAASATPTISGSAATKPSGGRQRKQKRKAMQKHAAAHKPATQAAVGVQWQRGENAVEKAKASAPNLV